MTRIKVCGLTCREDVEAAVALGVDALGFILTESARRVTLEKVAAITRGLSLFISTVAVVANPKTGELAKIAASGLFTHIQFHGQEVPEMLAGVQMRTIKAFGIASAEDLEQVKLYGAADYFLFDSRVGGSCGGTGKTFDWSLLKDIAVEKPVILAGGLGPENVAEAIRACRPAAVDLNSRLESEPGKKDPERIRQTVIEIREADSNILKE
ncbi:MAG: phosphoribosylanthranilate isomerase [Thermovirgaceae bacterium]|nr:phosphoribosylanthranilate isomerase [Thermovirgaceae bacterium]